MASSNLDLVRRIYEPWQRGEYGDTYWAGPDLEFVIADGPSPGTWKGEAGMADAWGDFLGAWTNHRTLADEYIELVGERVLVLGRLATRGRTSGLELGANWAKVASLFHIRDGTVTRLVLYFDRARALADVGLPPEPEGR
jgi:ketosteroid isomerase-like protein